MMHQLQKFFLQDRVLLGFIWVTLGYAFLYALITAHFTNAFVSGLTIAFTLVPTLLQRRYHIRLPRVISLFGVFFAYATLFLGEVHNFYELFWWWDLALHGGSAIMLGLIGLGVLQMMVSADKVQASPGVVSFLGFSFAFSIGALWEIIEFSIDFFFHTHMQTNSLIDTMGDLIIDGIGALIVTMIAYIHLKYYRIHFIAKIVEKMVNRYS